jgi:hypothetical protein
VCSETQLVIEDILARNFILCEICTGICTTFFVVGSRKASEFVLRVNFGVTENRV